jgi:hypothetical protein
MITKKGTSDIPLVMGIIGTVLNIPATFCAVSCGAFISGLSKITGAESGSEIGGFIIFSALISGFSGLVGGIYAKSNPQTGGTLLSLATVLSVIQSFVFGNMFSFLVFILYLIGAIFAFIKTEDIIVDEETEQEDFKIKRKPTKRINIENFSKKNENNGEVKNPYQ